MLMLDEAVRVYLYTAATDMRRSFDRLSEMVKEHFGRDVLNGGVYVFFSRKRDRVKLLYWDEDGYCFWMKRLGM